MSFPDAGETNLNFTRFKILTGAEDQGVNIAVEVEIVTEEVLVQECPTDLSQVRHLFNLIKTEHPLMKQYLCNNNSFVIHLQIFIRKEMNL